MPAQLGAHAHRSLSSRRVKGHEVLRVAPIIEQFFSAQRIEQRRHDRYIVTVLEQLKAQFRGRVVTLGERVERGRSDRARIEGVDVPATQGVTPL